MGYSTFYQAIPEQSRLLERLRSDQRFCCLFTWLIPYRPVPFRLDEMDPQGLDEFLDDFARREPFHSRAEVDECLKDVTAEIAFAVTTYPGLDRRNASIEKQHREIEDLLTQDLGCGGSETELKLIAMLLYEGDALVPDFFDPEDQQLSLIPAPIVAEGARLLAEAETSDEASYTNGYDYPYDQYWAWQRFLGLAASQGEAVLVTTS